MTGAFEPAVSGAHGIDEILYLEVELAAVARKELRRLQNLCRCRAGLIGLWLTSVILTAICAAPYVVSAML